MALVSPAADVGGLAGTDQGSLDNILRVRECIGQSLRDMSRTTLSSEPTPAPEWNGTLHHFSRPLMSTSTPTTEAIPTIVKTESFREGRPLIVGPDAPQRPFPIALSGPVQRGFDRGGKDLGCPTGQ